jgi:hypothetical protein
LHLVNALTIGKQQKCYKLEKLKKSILHYASQFGTADYILGRAQFKLSLIILNGGGFFFSEDYTCSLGQEILCFNNMEFFCIVRAGFHCTYNDLFLWLTLGECWWRWAGGCGRLCGHNKEIIGTHCGHETINNFANHLWL